MSAPDSNRCERVSMTLDQVMETDPPNIGWMTSELAHKVLGMMEAGRVRYMMMLQRQGMEVEEAKQRAGMEIPLLAFEVGLKIGVEMEKARAFREMMGETE